MPSTLRCAGLRRGIPSSTCRPGGASPLRPGEGGAGQPEFDTGVGRDLDGRPVGVPDLSRDGGIAPINPPEPGPEPGEVPVPQVLPLPVPGQGQGNLAGPQPDPEPPEPVPEPDPAPDPDDTFLEIEEDTRFVGAFPGAGSGGRSLVFQLVEEPENGTAEVAEDGTFEYVPAENYEGTDAFAYMVTDENGASGIAKAEVLVIGVNDPPVLTPTVFTLDASGGLTVDLATLADDPDPDEDGSTLVYAVVPRSDETSGLNVPASLDAEDGGPDYGAVVVEGTVLTFVPGPDYATLAAGETAVILFDLVATDAAGETTSETYALTVTGVNDAPTLSAGGLVAAEDGPAVTLDLSTLAFDPDNGDTLTFALVASPDAGAVTLDGAVLGFDPGPGFQALAEGEDSVQAVQVSVTDAAGASVRQQVAVTVQGSNDQPEAQDGISVAPGPEGVEGQVVAADVDGDALGFALVEGPDHGSVTLDAETGAYRYVGAEGFNGRDSFRVEVSDGQGGRDVAVIDVAVASGSATGPEGQFVSIGIDGQGAVQATADPVEAGAINVAFALDSSGSIGAAGWDEQVDNVVDAIALLAEQCAGSAVPVNVQVISYSSGVEATATYDLLTEAEALIADVQALEWQAGGTRWDLAFAQAETFFDGQSSEDNNFMFFITDGVPTGDYQAALDSLTDVAANGYAVSIEAYGIGLAPEMEVLDGIDSGGAATAVETPSDLAAGLTAAPIFAAQLVDFDLRLVADGIDRGSVMDLSGLGMDGADIVLDIAGIDGIADLLGDTNTFTATATYDFDGDLSTTGDQQMVATVAELGKADLSVQQDGSSGGDLLFGSDHADTIRGGAGDDLVLGHDGDDALKGGGGADQVLAGGGDDTIRMDAVDAGGETIDGGAGRDVLRLDMEGDIDDALFPVADISGIEVLDLDNGLSNTLDLTLSDVLDMTDDGAADIGALVEAADLTILGDAGDTVTLAAGDGQGVVMTGAEEPGFVTFDFVDGAGEVLASLAIDADVTVHTAAPSA